MSKGNNAIPEGFRITEIGIIPNDWVVTKVGDLADTKAGGTPSTERSEFWDGDIPWINSGALKDEAIKSPTKYITELGLRNSVTKLLPVNSVVIALTGATTGKVGLLNFACSTNQSIVGILPNPQFEPFYMFYALMHSRERIVGLKSGAAQPHINKQIVDSFVIPLPPILEQKAIAGVLSTIQKAFETQDKVIAAVRELKQSLMNHLFTYGSVPVPEAEKVTLKETEIGQIPEHWGVIRIGDVSESIRYGTSVLALTDEIGMPVLRIPNVLAGTIDTRDLKFVDLSERVANSYRLISGDLLFVRTNGQRQYVGRCAVFNDELSEALFASYLIRVRLQQDKILPKFVQAYSMTPNGREYLGGKASFATGGRFNINSQLLKNMLVPFPPLAEQQKINNMLSLVVGKIEAGENRKAALQALFKTILHHLMTGKIRVKDTEVLHELTQ